MTRAHVVLAAIALLGEASMAGSAQRPPVFEAAVETVHVDVFVSHDGEAVHGLTAANFELRDNGVRQSPELVSAELRPLRSILVFDTSSSVVGVRLVALKSAGRAFLDGLRPADEAGLIGFSEQVAWLAPVSADKAGARDALTLLEPEGATAVYDGLFAAIALAEDAARTVIVLFTDGEDNMSVLDARQVMTTTLRSNALVHAVGWMEAAPPHRPAVTGASRVPQANPWSVPEPAHVLALRRIAEATGGRFWPADSPERLRRAFAEIAESMGHRYVLRYDPAGVKRDGWHKIEIKLKGRKGDIQARKGYWVAPRRGNAAPPIEP